MIRFRVAEAPARGEYLVEAYAPACGNDAALIAVFNSQCAADAFAEWANSIRAPERAYCPHCGGLQVHHPKCPRHT